MSESMASDFEITSRINDIFRNITVEMDSEYLIQLIENFAKLALPKNTWQNFPLAAMILPKLIETRFFDVAEMFIQLFKGHHMLLLSQRENEWSALGCALNKNAYTVAQMLAQEMNELAPHHPLAAFWKESCPNTHKRLLHLAAGNSRVMLPLIDLIKNHPAKIHLNAMDQDWNTPLHATAQRLNVANIVALIEAGADLTIHNKQNQLFFDFFLGTDQAKNAAFSVFSQLTEASKMHFLTAYFDHIKTLALDSPAVKQYLALSCFFSLNYYLKARVVLGDIPLKPVHESLILLTCNDQMKAHYQAKKHGHRAQHLPEMKLSPLQFSDTVFEKLAADINQDITRLNEEWLWKFIHRFLMIVFAVMSVVLVAGISGALMFIVGDSQYEKSQALNNAGHDVWNNYLNNKLNVSETDALNERNLLYRRADKYAFNSHIITAVGIMGAVIGMAIFIAAFVLISLRWNKGRALSQREAAENLGDLPDELLTALNHLNEFEQSSIPPTDIQRWQNQVTAMKSPLSSNDMVETKQIALATLNRIRIGSYKNQIVLFKPREIPIAIEPEETDEADIVDDLSRMDHYELEAMPFLQRLQRQS